MGESQHTYYLKPRLLDKNTRHNSIYGPFYTPYSNKLHYSHYVRIDGHFIEVKDLLNSWNVHNLKSWNCETFVKVNVAGCDAFVKLRDFLVMGGHAAFTADVPLRRCDDIDQLHPMLQAKLVDNSHNEVQVQLIRQKTETKKVKNSKAKVTKKQSVQSDRHRKVVNRRKSVSAASMPVVLPVRARSTRNSLDARMFYNYQPMFDIGIYKSKSPIRLLENKDLQPEVHDHSREPTVAKTLTTTELLMDTSPVAQPTTPEVQEILVPHRSPVVVIVRLPNKLYKEYQVTNRAQSKTITKPIIPCSSSIPIEIEREFISRRPYVLIHDIKLNSLTSTDNVPKSQVTDDVQSTPKLNKLKEIKARIKKSSSKKKSHHKKLKFTDKDPNVLELKKALLRQKRLRAKSKTKQTNDAQQLVKKSQEFQSQSKLIFETKKNSQKEDRNFFTRSDEAFRATATGSPLVVASSPGPIPLINNDVARLSRIPHIDSDSDTSTAAVYAQSDESASGRKTPKRKINRKVASPQDTVAFEKRNIDETLTKKQRTQSETLVASEQVPLPENVAEEMSLIALQDEPFPGESHGLEIFPTIVNDGAYNVFNPINVPQNFEMSPLDINDDRMDESLQDNNNQPSTSRLDNRAESPESNSSASSTGNTVVSSTMNEYDSDTDLSMPIDFNGMQTSTPYNGKIDPGPVSPIMNTHAEGDNGNTIEDPKDPPAIEPESNDDQTDEMYEDDDDDDNDDDDICSPAYERHISQSESKRNSKKKKKRKWYYKPPRRHPKPNHDKVFHNVNRFESDQQVSSSQELLIDKTDNNQPSCSNGQLLNYKALKINDNCISSTISTGDSPARDNDNGVAERVESPTRRIPINSRRQTYANITINHDDTQSQPRRLSLSDVKKITKPLKTTLTAVADKLTKSTAESSST